MARIDPAEHTVWCGSTAFFAPASWDEALAAAADGLGGIKAAHGGNAIGMFSCSKATNEVNYLAQKFARTVLGTNNIDSCNRT